MEAAPTIDAFVRGPTLFRRGVIYHGEMLYGDPVLLVREPNNPKDSNAVLVTDQDDRPIGYIQRDKAAVLAVWMDKGWVYTGRVIVPAKITQQGNKRFVHPDTLVVRCTPIAPLNQSVTTKRTETLPKVKEEISW